MTSTICAPSTPSGGALGIIRVSGPQSIPIADVLFTSPSHQLLASAKGQTLHFGTITDSSGAIIDEVLLSLSVPLTAIQVKIPSKSPAMAPVSL